MIPAMIRNCLVVCLGLMTACKSKPTAEGAPARGSATSRPTVIAAPAPPPTGPVPALRWTDPEGELVLASGAGDGLTSACGVTGTLTPTTVTVAGLTEPWSALQRTGRVFSLPKLDWTIEVSPAGAVTHKRGGTDTPLGTVTGLTGDAELAWFGGLIIGAALIQHKVALTLPTGRALELAGAADLRAWEIKEAGQRIASKNRDDPAPVISAPGARDVSKLTVVTTGPGTLEIRTVGDPAAEVVKVSEAAGGALTRQVGAAPPTPLGTLRGRAACKAHDRAVAALLTAALATEGTRASK